MVNLGLKTNHEGKNVVAPLHPSTPDLLKKILDILESMSKDIKELHDEYLKEK